MEFCLFQSRLLFRSQTKIFNSVLPKMKLSLTRVFVTICQPLIEGFLSIIPLILHLCIYLCKLCIFNAFNFKKNVEKILWSLALSQVWRMWAPSVQFLSMHHTNTLSALSKYDIFLFFFLYSLFYGNLFYYLSVQTKEWYAW